MRELVSVIIPTHNRSKFLKRAIQSAIDQTYSDLEIIVVDDGSTDDTAQLIRRYLHMPSAPPVRYIYQPNRGPAAARNLGIEAARGRYLAYLDDDDLFAPEKVAFQVDKFRRNSRLGMVATGAYIVDENERILEAQLPLKTSFETQTWKLLYNCSYINSSVMVKVECHQRVGVFRDRDLEDYDMWLRIARDFPIGTVQKPLVKYRRHGSQITNPENYRRILNATQRIVVDFLYERPLKESFPKLKSEGAERLFKGAFLCRHGLFDKARGELFAAKDERSAAESYGICASLWLGLVELYNRNYDQAKKQFEAAKKAKAKPNHLKFAADGLSLLKTMRQNLTAEDSPDDLKPDDPKIESLRKSLSRLQVELTHHTVKLAFGHTA